MNDAIGEDGPAGTAGPDTPCQQRGSDGRWRADRPWTEELGEAYLMLLRATGNARASARALGHPHLFDNRRRRHPDFSRKCEAALAEADARLRSADSPFLPAGSTGPIPGIEVKSVPADEGPPEGPEPRIRRTSNGRTQISYVREGELTSAQEAEFLAFLRETGNFEASARAIGFSPGTLHRRLHRWPAFARQCEQAREEAAIGLEYKLVAHCHALLRGPGEARPEGEAEVPFDPEAAMRILHFLDRRSAGRLGARPRKGQPERSFEQAVESILAKVDAIDRHRKLMKEKAQKDEGDGP